MALRDGKSLDWARKSKFKSIFQPFCFPLLEIQLEQNVKVLPVRLDLLAASLLFWEGPKVHNISLELRETPGLSEFTCRWIPQLITKPSWSHSSKYFDANAWVAFKSLITVTMLIMFMVGGWERRKGMALSLGLLICHLEPSVTHPMEDDFPCSISHLCIPDDGPACWWPWNLGLVDLSRIAWEPQKLGCRELGE